MSMIHEITSLSGPNKAPKRKGRGRASGHGKTCGRGTKGAKARVGTYIKRGHEGGQTPIFRRLPKRGFSNDRFERRLYIVNLVELNRFEDGAVVDASAMIQSGLVPDDRQGVKILGEGSLSKKLTVVATRFSKSAWEKIAQAGGVAQNLKGEPFELPKPKKRFVLREREVVGGKKSKKLQEASAQQSPGEGAKEGKKAEEKPAEQSPLLNEPGVKQGALSPEP